MEAAPVESTSDFIPPKSVPVSNPPKKVKFNKPSNCWTIENSQMIENDENENGGEKNRENDQNQPNMISSDAESIGNSSIIEVIVDHNYEFIDDLNTSNECTNSIQKKKSSIERGDNLLNDFFQNVEINGKRISANCASCEKSYKADFSSICRI